MQAVYVIWALLPLTLMFFGIRSYVRLRLKQGPREDPKDYFFQAGFCWMALFLSVGIDTLGFNALVDLVTAGTLDAGFVRWLIYPAVLLLLALGHAQYKQHREHQEKIPKRGKRPNYARGR